MTTLDLCTAQLQSVSGARVQKLVLQVSRKFRFQAGQYLQIVHPTGVLIPLSIATAPHRLPELHLHYQSSNTPEAVLMDELLATFKQGTCEFSINGPLGNVVLEATPTRPLALIAGGTGAAQMASFIDQLSKTPPLLDVTLLFCAGTNADLYLRPWLADLDTPWLNPILIADARRTPGNRGLTWLKDQAEKLLTHRIVLSGSPGFVYAATDTLTQSGIAESALESDVFSYAPRS